MGKKRLLYYGDTPNVATGFGNVARHVLGRVLDRYDITVFGVNEYFVNPNPLPVARTIAALPNPQNDPYGKQKFVEFLTGPGSANNNFDIWFLQNDIHAWGWLPEIVTVLRSKGRDPHIFTYTVVDSPVRREDTWFLGCVDVAGIPSQYGVDEIIRVDPSVAYKLRHIPHGIDTSEFFPMPKDLVKKFRRDTMNCHDQEFLIINVNRNSMRKEIGRTLLYFSHLRKRCPNARLYLHMDRNEEGYRGWDLNRVIDTNRSVLQNVAFPQDFNTNQGVDVTVLNMLYNAANVVISTTAGEGFGLSCIEAMAAHSLVMMADNSSLSELMADGRGIPIRCGTTPSEWTIHSHDPGHFRPLVNIEDMVAKTEKIIRNYPSDVSDRGYQWVTSKLLWDDVVKLFIAGFDDVIPNLSIPGRIEL